MKNSFCSDRMSDGYSSFYFTTGDAVFAIATNPTLAWSGFESVSSVNILNIQPRTGVLGTSDSAAL
jgi:hypothetical protein